MRDTIYNAIAAFVILTIAVGFVFGLVSMGKRWHAAEACQEDEAWIAVDHNTPNAFVDSHGVTRACINIDDMELYRFEGETLWRIK